MPIETGQKRKFMETEPWLADEVSTRNCYHCLAPKEGIYVSCRMKHLMITISGQHKRRLTYNGVIRLARLMKPCESCPDFDNHWE